jgi:hypothetical protein
MLKRLYLTDVGRKEIDELKRTQDRAQIAEEELKTLRPAAQQSATLRGEVQRLTSENESLRTLCDTQKDKLEIAIKENDAFRKVKEGFVALGAVAPSVDIEKRLGIFKEEIKSDLQQLFNVLGKEGQKVAIDIDTAIENKINEKLAGVNAAEVSVSLSQPKLVLEKEIGKVKLSNKDVRGRLAIMYAEGLLPSGKSFGMGDVLRLSASRFGMQEALLRESNHATNIHLKAALMNFVNWGYLVTVQAGKRTDYRIKMSPEEARKKGLIEETEVRIDA